MCFIGVLEIFSLYVSIREYECYGHLTSMCVRLEETAYSDARIVKVTFCCIVVLEKISLCIL